MDFNLNSRIIRVKIGIREIFEATLKKQLSFKEKEIIRQVELIKHSNYEVAEEESFYKIRKGNENIFLRKDSSDLSVFEQVFLKEEYKALVDVVLLNKIDINNIIDLGSNIGLASLYFKRYFSHAPIICVEPDKDNFRILSRNLDSLKAIKLYECAIWNNEKQVGLNNGFRDGLGWSISVSEDQGSSFASVQAITIDKIIGDNGIDVVGILKIDIEGSEFVLFKSLDDIGFLRKVKIIAIEIHEDVGPKVSIIEKLLAYDFILFEYSETIIGVNRKFVSQ